MTTAQTQAISISRLAQWTQRQTAVVRRLAEGTSAAGLLGTLDRRIDQATVVVLGEPSKGKSNLVNALIGWPGLSPVDAAETTGTYLEFSYGEPSATAFLPSGGEGLEAVPLELAALADWTTLDALERRSTAADGEARTPQLVRVTVPSDLLRHLTLIDSPGAGGLRGARRAANNLATATASAILFVTDAKSPLTAPELAFLAEVSDQVALLIFAVTMTDELSDSDVSSVLAEMRTLLRERAPQLADSAVVPVSAHRAERSQDPRRPADMRARQLELSGIDSLRRILIDDVGRRGEALVHAATLSRVAAIAEVIAQDCDAQAAALEAAAAGNPQRTAPDIARERTELADLIRRADASARGYLSDAGSAGREELSSRAVGLRNDLVREAKHEASVTTMAATADAAAQQIARQCMQHVDRAVSEWYHANFGPRSDTAELELALTVVHDRLGAAFALPGPVQARVTALPTDAKINAALGGTAGASALSVIARIGIGGAVLANPVTIVLGVAAMGMWRWQASKKQNRRQDIQQWIDEQMAQYERELGRAIRERVIETTTAVVQGLTLWASTRGAALDNEADQLRAEPSADTKRTAVRLRGVAASARTVAGMARENVVKARTLPVTA